MKESEVKGMAATAQAVEEFYRGRCINLAAKIFELKEEASAMASSISERDREIAELLEKVEAKSREVTDLKEMNANLLRTNEALNNHMAAPYSVPAEEEGGAN